MPSCGLLFDFEMYIYLYLLLYYSQTLKLSIKVLQVSLILFSVKIDICLKYYLNQNHFFLLKFNFMI